MPTRENRYGCRAKRNAALEQVLENAVSAVLGHATSTWRSVDVRERGKSLFTEGADQSTVIIEVLD